MKFEYKQENGRLGKLV